MDFSVLLKVTLLAVASLELQQDDQVHVYKVLCAETRAYL